MGAAAKCMRAHCRGCSTEMATWQLSRNMVLAWASRLPAISAAAKQVFRGLAIVGDGAELFSA